MDSIQFDSSNYDILTYMVSSFHYSQYFNEKFVDCNFMFPTCKGTVTKPINHNYLLIVVSELINGQKVVLGCDQ